MYLVHGGDTLGDESGKDQPSSGTDVGGLDGRSAELITPAY
jgi:hypothetical protein